MSSDNHKSVHSFQCRDLLWERFEQMARELECSVDYLINDAMKQYARQRGYGGGSTATMRRVSIPPAAPSTGFAPAGAAFPSGLSQQPPSSGVTGNFSAVPNSAIPTSSVPSAPPLAAPAPFPGAPPLPGALAATQPIPQQRPPAPPPPRPAGMAPPPPAPSPLAAPPPLAASPLAAPPLAAPPLAAPPPPAPAAAMNRRLLIAFEGQEFPVNQDRFIIGRGKQSSELTIKDPNVSRQHAAVERVGSDYFIVDLGSTNGIDYRDQKVTRQLIQNGDKFSICEHEMTFIFV